MRHSKHPGQHYHANATQRHRLMPAPAARGRCDVPDCESTVPKKGQSVVGTLCRINTYLWERSAGRLSQGKLCRRSSRISSTGPLCRGAYAGVSPLPALLPGTCCLESAPSDMARSRVPRLPMLMSSSSRGALWSLNGVLHFTHP